LPGRETKVLVGNSEIEPELSANIMYQLIGTIYFLVLF